MKILHTSDWHIGQTLRNFDREDEHRHFVHQLAEILRIEQPDALVMSGDVYHTPLPTIQSQQLMVEALAMLQSVCPRMLIVLIAGNHDSAARLEIHRHLWLAHNIHIVGRIADTNAIIPLPEDKGTIIAMPYMSRMQFTDVETKTSPAQRQSALMAELISQAREHPGPIVMMAHTSVGNGKSTDTIGGIESRPLSSLPEGYDYLALGHIHLPIRLSERAEYCGSPFPLSFDEDYGHHVNVVTIAERGAIPDIKRIDIEPLRSMLTIEANSPQKAIEQLATLPDDGRSYVRVVIDTPDLLPADIDDRARVALQDKEYRFCGCTRKVHEAQGKTPESGEEMEVDEFRQLPPIEIARKYFEDESVENAPVLLELLSQVIDNLSTTEEQ